MEKITSRFFWRNMNEEIRQFVQNCDKCQRMNAKFVKSNAKLHPIPVSAKVWQLFNSDQDVLIHGEELTGALIDAAQKLLSKKYPRINGLQSPSLAALLQFNPTPTRAVQIHHTGKSA